MRRFAIIAAFLATPAASYACAMRTYDDVAIARALDEIDRPTPVQAPAPAAPEAAVPADQAQVVAPAVPAPQINAPVVPVIRVAPPMAAPPVVAAKKTDS